MNKVRVHFLISPEDAEFLDFYARQTHRTKSEVWRMLLERLRTQYNMRITSTCANSVSVFEEELK